MSVSNNNKHITAPVSIADVKSVLGASSDDLGTLCKNGNINMWSRIRPCKCVQTATETEKITMRLNVGNDADGGASVNPLADLFGTDTSANSSGEYIVYNNGMPKTYYMKSASQNGVKIPGVSSYLNSGQTGINQNLVWQFPKPEVFRLTDFDGYWHDAPVPITDDIATDGIIYRPNNESRYDIDYTVFKFDMNTYNDSGNKWKSAKPGMLFGVDINHLNNLGRYYLAFAFASTAYNSDGIANYYFRISTGKKIGDLFFNNVQGNQNLTLPSESTDPKKPARSFVLGQGSIAMFGFVFKDVKDALFSNVSFADGMQWYVRAILTKDVSMQGQGYFEGNGYNDGIHYKQEQLLNSYSFEVKQGFGVNLNCQLVNTTQSSAIVVTEFSSKTLTLFGGHPNSPVSRVTCYEPVYDSDTGQRKTMWVTGRSGLDNVEYYVYKLKKLQSSTTQYNDLLARFTFTGTPSSIKAVDRRHPEIVIQEYNTHSNPEPFTDIAIDSDGSSYTSSLAGCLFCSAQWEGETQYSVITNSNNHFSEVTGKAGLLSFIDNNTTITNAKGTVTVGTAASYQATVNPNNNCQYLYIPFKIHGSNSVFTINPGQIRVRIKDRISGEYVDIINLESIAQ